MKQIEVPFVPGDKVWTFTNKCIRRDKIIKCPDCGHCHSHGPDFKLVPVRATVEAVKVNNFGWSLELGWKIKNGHSGKNFRGRDDVWTSRKEALEFCNGRRNF